MGDSMPSEFVDSSYDAVDMGLCHPHVVASGSVLPGRRRYLIFFMHRHLNFRLAEAQAVAETVHGSTAWDGDGLPIVVWELPQGGVMASPFWYVHLHSEAIAAGIARHAMLVRCIIEVWGEGPTREEAQAAAAACRDPEREHYCAPDQSFRFTIERWGTTITMAEKVDIIESYQYCTAFKGKIDLVSPMHTWWVIESVEAVHTGLPAIPLWQYFGRLVAMGEARAQLQRYDLRQRRYLGPTSMDTELAFIMCAMGGVRRSSLVLDPFAGTGSVMVAAAALGALTMGTDIDIRVIKIGKKDKKGDAVNIWTNFSDYALPPPVGVLRADVHRPPFRTDLVEILDAVVGDPPYGVRAGARKSRTNPDVAIPDRATHRPGTDPYQLAECLRDLVELSAKLLVVGGSCVFWIPATPEKYFEEELPRHPAMERVANCEQVLASRYSRRLVVMRKARAYDAAAAEEHYAAAGPPRMAQDELSAKNVYENTERVAGESRTERRGRAKLVQNRARNKCV